MMAKMYYSEPETCELLGVDADGLMELVNSGKLQMYQDGPKHVYKASDVDTLKQEMPAEDEGELTLADTSVTEPITANDELTLEIADEAMEATPQFRKEDTVITAEGISIFDDEDLEIEEADPMAETQIAPSLDDQVALDGVGSGSGLLDLTRESDDTSLGVEVLDHIDMDSGSGLSGGFGGSGLSGGFSGSGMAGGFDQAPAPQAAAPAPAYSAEPPVFVEPADASVGFFTGLMTGVALLAIIIIAAAAAVHNQIETSIVKTMQDKIGIVAGVGGALIIIAGIIGMFIGKSIHNKREMLDRMSK